MKVKLNISRDDIINALNNENIESRPVWKPMHLQPFFSKYIYLKKNNKDYSFNFFEEGICLPSGSSLKEKDQSRIIDIILSMIK